LLLSHHVTVEYSLGWYPDYK